MRLLLTIILCLAISCAAYAQDREVIVTPVDGPLLTVDPAAPAGVCVYGNQTAAAYAITDWIWGQESYATVFNAPQTPCGCGVGFTIEQVHFYMNFRATDVPATFDVSVDFQEANPDGSGCNVPGPVICTSPVYTVNITTAGLYNIALPTGACGCAFFDFDYAVSINFPNAFPATMRPDAVTNNAPVGCMSFNDYGTGWTDTFSFGFPGELIMFADVICCEPAVPNEDATWGSLKSLYK